jgi:anti-sigma factor RsiW
MAQHVAPELLSALLDEELDPAESREVHSHLGSCLHCRQRLEGLRRVAAGLRDLERPALPPVLDLALRRRLALDRPADTLRERLQEHLSASRALSAQVGLGFALVLALAAIGFLFTHALERGQAGSVLVPVGPSAVEESVREAGGRRFVREGTVWRELHVAGEPSRTVARDSEEGREILELHPDLEALFEHGHAVELRWGGEVIAVVEALEAPAEALP